MTRLLLSVLFFLFCSFCSAQTFMKVVGANGTISGTSTDSAHPKQIEVDSYSNITGLCASGNCIEMREVVVRVPFYEPALVLLRRELVNKSALSEVVLSFQKRFDAEFHDYYKITMKDVIISSITEVGSGIDGITTQITFKPAKSGWTFTPKEPGKVADTPVKFGWDFELNRAWTGF